MKFDKKPLLAAIMGTVWAFSAQAWTTVDPAPLTPNDPSPVEMSIRPASFSDPNFGYQGWAMHGKWGTFEAVKGRSYKIIVDGRTQPGLHPAVAVWKRPIGTPSQPYVYPDGGIVTNLTPANRVPDHNFFPVQSYISSGRSQQHAMESTANNNCTTPWTKTIGGNSITAACHEFWKAALRPAAQVTANTGLLLEDGSTEIGMARMLFVKAAWDADKAPSLQNNSLNVNPALIQQKDKKAGYVTLTFKADESALYQIFVGGMNPDSGVDTAVPMPVLVHVKR